MDDAIAKENDKQLNHSITFSTLQSASQLEPFGSRKEKGN
jgi:hypothetical protein